MTLTSVVLPLLVFALWVGLAPSSSRQFGIDVVKDRLLLEYLLLGACILALLMTLGSRALAARAQQLGMAVPARWRMRDVACVLLICSPVFILVAYYLATWSPLMFRPRLAYAAHAAVPVFVLIWMVWHVCWFNGQRLLPVLGWGTLFALIAAVVAAVFGYICSVMLAWVDVLVDVGEGTAIATCVGAGVGLCWGFVRLILNRMGASRFTSSALRSFVPMLVVAALALTAIVAPVLMWIETSAVRRINDPAAAFLFNEIDRSDLRLVRDWIVNGQ